MEKRKSPESLKEFLINLSPGTKLRLVMAYYEGKPDTNHKALHHLRAIHKVNTKDIMFMMLEGPKEGNISYLNIPKAKWLTFLNDERGFYGFRIDDPESKVSLVYNFEE